MNDPQAATMVPNAEQAGSRERTNARSVKSLRPTGDLEPLGSILSRVLADLEVRIISTQGAQDPPRTVDVETAKASV